MAFDTTLICFQPLFLTTQRSAGSYDSSPYLSGAGWPVEENAFDVRNAQARHNGRREDTRCKCWIKEEKRTGYKVKQQHDEENIAFYLCGKC